MKKRILQTVAILFIFALTGLTFSCATDKKEKPATGNERGFVLDSEYVLTASQEMQLDSLFAAHEKRTTNQIVVLTTPGYEGDENIATFSIRLFNSLGIGRKDVNNGVLVVFSKTHRETRIATGLGTEKVLKDEVAKKIIDSLMIPQFRYDSIFEGIWRGSVAIVDFLDKPENKITGNEK